MTLDKLKLLALYDAEMRRSPLAVPGTRIEVLERVTRAPDCILFSALNEATADDEIAAQRAHFTDLGQGFEWKLYEHDGPADLKSRLLKAGFLPGENETLMALWLPAAPVFQDSAPGYEFRRLTTTASLRDVRAVKEAVWGKDAAAQVEALAAELAAAPDRLSIYAVYAGEEPVGSAWIRFYPGRPFADLWGGSILAEHRGRGLYRALVGLRVAAAQAQGVRYLTIDAGPMSCPILERLGFQRLSGTTPYVWAPQRLMRPSAELGEAFAAMAADYREAGESLYQQDFPAYLCDAADAAAGLHLPPGHVPATTFWLVADGRICGVSRLRHYLTPALEQEGGHIECDVPPSVRRRGYGTKLLELTLAEARRCGWDEVLVVCPVDDKVPASLAEANSGELLGYVVSHRDGSRLARYRVKL